eukprot:141104_1
MSCYVGEWSVVPVRSDSLQQIPAARCGHTLTAIGSDAANQKLLLIGGQSGLTHNREFLSDMHLFDPARAHWSPLRASSRHKWLARADHAAAAFGPGAVAFGGRHGDTYLSDTTLFRLDDGEEKEVSIVPLFCPSTPCARRGASLQLSRDGASFLLFGGQAGALFLDDLWRLDAAQGGGARWVREACGGGKGGGPTARAFHASFLDASGNLVVLGGVQSTKAAPAPPAAHSFDPRAGRWSRLTPADGDHLSKPLAMGHVQAHRLADEAGNETILLYESRRSGGVFTVTGDWSSCSQISLADRPASDSRPAKDSRPASDSRPAKDSRPASDSRPARVSRTATALLSDGSVHRMYAFGGFVHGTDKSVSSLRCLTLCEKSQAADNRIGHIYSDFIAQPHDSLCLPPVRDTTETNASLLRSRDTTETNASHLRSPEASERSDSHLRSRDTTERSTSPVRSKAATENNAIPIRSRDTTDGRINHLRSRHSTDCFASHLRSRDTTGNFASPAQVSAGRPGKRRLAQSRGEVTGQVNTSMRRHDKAHNAKTLKVTLSQTPVKSTAKLESNALVYQVPNIAGKKLNFGVDPSMLAASEDEQSLAWRVIDFILIKHRIPGDTSAFFMQQSEILDLCSQAQSVVQAEPSMLEVSPPLKVFGDIHGQMDDLLSIFKAFGQPDHLLGDINIYKYVFLGDFVDRGRRSLEVICLLFALKIRYPKKVFLVRGNHEQFEMNKNYGFQEECRERIRGDAETVIESFSAVWRWLPLAAMISDRILCVHGGIGRLKSLHQIRSLRRPIDVDGNSRAPENMVLTDLLWSDPSESDSVHGVKPSARGISVVFGSDRVVEFCRNNRIDLIVRAHQVVSEGYEYFAGGHLITLFSATNYCGLMNNHGAILVISADLVVTPKIVLAQPTPHPDAWRTLVDRPPSPMRGAAAKGEVAGVFELGGASGKSDVNMNDGPLP